MGGALHHSPHARQRGEEVEALQQPQSQPWALFRRGTRSERERKRGRDCRIYMVDDQACLGTSIFSFMSLKKSLWRAKRATYGQERKARSDEDQGHRNHIASQQHSADEHIRPTPRSSESPIADQCACRFAPASLANCAANLRSDSRMFFALGKCAASSSP